MLKYSYVQFVQCSNDLSKCFNNVNALTDCSYNLTVNSAKALAVNS